MSCVSGVSAIDIPIQFIRNAIYYFHLRLLRQTTKLSISIIFNAVNALWPQEDDGTTNNGQHEETGRRKKFRPFDGDVQTAHYHPSSSEVCLAKVCVCVFGLLTWVLVSAQVSMQTFLLIFCRNIHPSSTPLDLHHWPIYCQYCLITSHPAHSRTHST